MTDKARCPRCGEQPITIDIRFQAVNSSLSGSQLKVGAKEVPWLLCDACGLSVEGRVETDPVNGKAYAVFEGDGLEGQERRVTEGGEG